MKLIINFVDNCQATSVTQAETTWDELKSLLMDIQRKGRMTLHDYHNATDQRRKADKDGLAWIPCSVIDPDGKRTQANMDQAYLLVLDIDSGMQLDDVKKRVQGFEAVIHSSFSHTPEHPKWRVVFPLAESLPAKKIGLVFDHFQAKFDGLLDSSCGHDPSRLYYVPSCPADAEYLFHCEHLEGKLLDGEVFLKEGISAPVALPVSSAAASSRAPTNISAGVSSGGRNNAAFKLAAKLFGDGLGIDEVTETVLTWNENNDPPLDENEVRQTVKSAMKTVERKAVAVAEQADEVVDEMNKKYAWVKKQRSIHRFEFRDFIPIESLRQHHANTAIKVRVGDTTKWQTHADVWFRSPQRRTHSDVDFAPGAGAIVDDKINLWRGWGTTPVAGDVTPWIAFLDFLFAGDPDARKWIEQWIAYPLQHPSAKLTTAVVLWSVKQGVGKSMVGETIGKLYGAHFKTISAVELHGSFNGWMRDCQLVLGEENSSSDQRADSNRLKALITGNTVFINEKYQPQLELPNCANFIFTSNHPDAFHLDDADRRFFVWEIVANRMPNEFYDEFIDWRDNRGGLAALMDHLMKLDLTGFLAKGNAPVTEAKREMIRQSKSDLERWMADVLDDPVCVHSTFGKEIVHLDEITEAYTSQRRCRTTSTAVSRAFRRTCAHAKRRVMTKKRRQNLISLTNHERWEAADSSAWAAEYDRPSAVVSV